MSTIRGTENAIFSFVGCPIPEDEKTNLRLQVKEVQKLRYIDLREKRADEACIIHI